jgi:hypothetical protein
VSIEDGGHLNGKQPAGWQFWKPRGYQDVRSMERFDWRSIRLSRRRPRDE